MNVRITKVQIGHSQQLQLSNIIPTVCTHLCTAHFESQQSGMCSGHHRGHAYRNIRLDKDEYNFFKTYFQAKKIKNPLHPDHPSPAKPLVDDLYGHFYSGPCTIPETWASGSYLEFLPEGVDSVGRRYGFRNRHSQISHGTYGSKQFEGDL